LDEADVMLNMGFRDDIELILQSVPKERQTVFFSATMPRPIRDLIEKYSREPQNVKIEQKAMTVPTVEQIYYEVDRRFKMELLTRLIDIHDLKLGIIFCNTKRMVDDLVDYLEAAGYMADRLHGDMNQAQRDRVMNKFRKSGLEFLVATDIAARGIDVDDVEVVFNYDLPYDGEDYVHRIGRTGRAGRSGRAITFVSGRELFQIRHIERYTNTRVQRARIPTEAEVEEARENVFIGKIRATLQSGEFKKQDALIERLLEEGFTSTDIASACLAQLQGGEAAPKPAARTEEYDRPERDERPPRGNFRDGPRPERGGRFDRPQRYDERPRQDGTPFVRPIRSAKPFSTGAPASAPARLKKIPAPQAGTESGAPMPAPASAPEPVRAEAVPPATPPPSSPASTDTEILPAPAAPASPAPAPVAPAKPVKFPAPKLAKTYPVRSFGGERPPPFAGHRERAEPWLAGKPSPKPSRRTPTEQTRLWMNVGEEMGVGPGDVVGAILGETGLPTGTVGTVDIRERHLFVDVTAEHVNAIISKLNRARIKGNKLKVKVA
ncbi:MAG: DbpA RNA binding domain-containing protein, partial [Verrucomicrobia bacterium]|nr:DbpA RNA binding domain-containing protein [Verrucomicrobiota bacterium]